MPHITFNIAALNRRAGRGAVVAMLCLSMVVLAGSLAPAVALAQESPGEETAEQRAERALAGEPDAAGTDGTGDISAQGELSVPILDLFLRGGWLMAPIGIMSLIVVAIGFERMLGLRRSRVVPEHLVRGLGEMAERGTFEPRSAYRLCQHYPSSTATVIRTMLLKVGRPHNEVEHTVSEACQREADRLYSNVRTLNLAAAVTPLLGLLGTVWGMIQSFFVTANLPLGSNKGQALAEGIYVALMTTFGGLAVAIPAAVLAHLFEGRILRLMREVEHLLGTLLPQVEQYEGKLRIDQEHLSQSEPVRKRQPVRQETKAS